MIYFSFSFYVKIARSMKEILHEKHVVNELSSCARAPRKYSPVPFSGCTLLPRKHCPVPFPDALFLHCPLVFFPSTSVLVATPTTLRTACCPCNQHPPVPKESAPCPPRSVPTTAPPWKEQRPSVLSFLGNASVVPGTTTRASASWMTLSATSCAQPSRKSLAVATVRWR